jgi:hypothetical protein
MLLRSSARMVWESAGISEEVEALIRGNKLADGLPGARLSKAHGDFTNDLVSVVTPGERVATEGNQTRDHQCKSSHATYPTK